ncbi:MAG TPA: serine/threonine-protein kinase [Ktedonobacteraceae bacterium]|jgi:serine/threonine protein kinase
MTDLIGQQLGNYRLTRLLGQGAFADVYLGEHIELATLVAIKILREIPDDEGLKNFRQEAQILANLKHANIVRVFDFGVDANKTPFFVMDYFHRGSILNIHPRGQAVPLKSIISYVNQIAQALTCAHGAGVIHRDVKPENLLLGTHQEVLLSDFGIAVMAHSSVSMTTQNAAGTISYMAPEHCKGRPEPASDQYSLAVVVYEWLCGTVPFKGTFYEIFHHQLFTSPPSLRNRVSTISPKVEEIVFRALAKEPKRRFDSVQEFATALAKISSVATQTSPPKPQDVMSSSSSLQTTIYPSSPSPQTPIPPTIPAGPFGKDTGLPKLLPIKFPPTETPPTQTRKVATSLPKSQMHTPSLVSTERKPKKRRNPLRVWANEVSMWTSWIIWSLIVCFSYESTTRGFLFDMFNPGRPLSSSPPPVLFLLLISLSGIALFFLWGVIFVQRDGKIEEGFFPRNRASPSAWVAPIFVGVVVITCTCDICVALDSVFSNGKFDFSYILADIVVFIVGLLFGLLSSAFVCILAILMGLISTTLGCLIGNVIYVWRNATST